MAKLEAPAGTDVADSLALSVQTLDAMTRKLEADDESSVPLDITLELPAFEAADQEMVDACA